MSTKSNAFFALFIIIVVKLHLKWRWLEKDVPLGVAKSHLNDNSLPSSIPSSGPIVSSEAATIRICRRSRTCSILSKILFEIQIHPAQLDWSVKINKYFVNNYCKSETKNNFFATVQTIAINSNKITSKPLFSSTCSV